MWCFYDRGGGVPIDTHPMSHRGREFYTQVWHRHIGRGELPLSIVTASEIVRVLFFTARFIRHVPTTHSDSDDLNFLYIFSWLEKVNESKLIVQPDELDDVNELEPSKNTTRRVQKWEVLKSPRDVSFFFYYSFLSNNVWCVCTFGRESFPVSVCAKLAWHAGASTTSWCGFLLHSHYSFLLHYRRVPPNSSVVNHARTLMTNFVECQRESL